MRNLILILLTFVMVGCTSKKYSDNLDRQTKAIESYMSKYKYTIQEGTYVTIIEKGEAGASIPVFGDTISFNYIESEFTTQPGNFISTNIKSVAEELKLTTPNELLVPIEIEWGVTPIMLGLKGALMWATKGEHILAIIPFNLGYNDEWNNSVAPYTSLAFEIYILDIKKKNER